MLAQFLAPRLARFGLHYGWVVVVTAFLSSVATSGAVGLPGAFIVPLSHEFGWDNASISGALALRFLLFGAMAPFAAALIERYGMRRMMLTSIALIVAALALAPAITRLWQLVVLWGVVVGIGSGLTALVLGAAVANRWFQARRGLTLGLLTAAVSTGQLVFLPLAASIIARAGWRLALVPSIVGLLAVAVLVLLLMADWPAEVGLAPVGARDIAPVPARRGTVTGAMLGSVTALGEGSRSLAFWILTVSFFVCGLSTNGLVQTHFIPLCIDNGLTGVEGATTLAMMGIFDVFGTIGSGWLSDRFDSRWLLAWYYGLRGLSLLWLPFSGFTVIGLGVFGVFYGLDWIATVPPTVRLAGAAFGRPKAAILFGWVFFGHQIGSAIAAYGGGLSRTLLGSYLPAFFAAGAVCVGASLIVMLLRSDKAPAAAVA